MCFEFFVRKHLSINFDVMHNWFPDILNKCAACVFQLPTRMMCYFCYKLLDQINNCNDCYVVNINHGRLLLTTPIMDPCKHSDVFTNYWEHTEIKS